MKISSFVFIALAIPASLVAQQQSGRTDTNDLIVPDAQVSKCHAFFRLVSGHVELSDLVSFLD